MKGTAAGPGAAAGSGALLAAAAAGGGDGSSAADRGWLRRNRVTGSKSSANARKASGSLSVGYRAQYNSAATPSARLVSAGVEPRRVHSLMAMGGGAPPIRLARYLLRSSKSGGGADEPINSEK